jgi:hypothetical protein
VHELFEIDPKEGDAVPAGHGVHATALIMSDQNPGAQSTQVLDPVALNVPSLQLWHPERSVTPVRLLNVPAGHWAQSDTLEELLDGL